MNLPFRTTPAHRSPRRRALLGATAAACLLGAAGTALAQDAWPSKPIRVIVGFPAGGTTDIMARVVGTPLQKALGQPIVVENRPGASGNIAASETLRAAPDGYTFMVAPISVQTANPSLFKPALNLERDLRPVVSLGYAQLYLVTRKALPVADVPALVSMAKARPGGLSYGSGGPGTQMHLVGELFKQQAGVDVVHVPYKGAAPALQDVLAGQIDYYFDPAAGFQHIREGRAHLLAVTGTRRSSFFPDTPTLTEAGVRGVELGNWFGLFAPARTPPAILKRMAEEVARTLQLPEVKQRYNDMGVETIAQDAATFGQTIADETVVLKQLIQTRNIVLD